MKKILFALAATTLVSTPAFADTTTISGDVAPVCTIDGPADTASIDLTSRASQSLGNVRIVCNSVNGYDATASSGNGGNLNSGVRSAAVLDYNLDALGASVSLATTQGVTVSPGNQASVDGYDIPVGITITGNRNGNPLFAGRYQDTITWAITAN